MIVKEVILKGKVSDFDLISVRFGGDDRESLMVGFYSEIVPFIGQNVEVTFHEALYEGAIQRFILSITGVTKITTVESGEKIKLFSEFVDNNSTINFKDIDDGDIVTGVVLCLKQEFKSSSKSTWHELLIRDKSGRSSVLRIFGTNKVQGNLAGRYITGSLKKNMPFGFEASNVEVTNGIEAIDPDVEIAESYVKSFLEKNNTELLEYVNSTSLLKFMKEYVEEGRGSTIVKLAIQLELLQAMDNIVPGIDRGLLISALLLQYGYVTSVSKKGYSRSIRNFHFMNLIKYPNDKKERMMLLISGSEDSQDTSIEKSVFDQVVSTADTLYNLKKGAV